MNRRDFLGLALSSAALAASPIPTLATPSFDSEQILALRHTHTGERIDLAYRAGERYLHQGLRELNRFLRDFRTGDMARMDPQLFDTLSDIAREVGRTGSQFEIISGYRSARTNEMLRRASGGVARKSYHLTGQALDIRMSGVSTRRLRDAAVALQHGGVGYYSRSNFLHIDTGPVRQWAG